MDENVAILITVLFAGIMSGYTTRVTARGSGGDEVVLNQGLFRDLPERLV